MIKKSWFKKYFACFGDYDCDFTYSCPIKTECGLKWIKKIQKEIKEMRRLDY